MKFQYGFYFRCQQVQTASFHCGGRWREQSAAEQRPFHSGVFFVTFCTGNDGFQYRQFQRTENFSIAVIQVFGNTFVHPVPEHMDTTQGYILMPVHVFPDGKDKRHAAPHCHSFLRDGSEYIIHIDYGLEYTGHIYGARKVKKDKVIIQLRLFKKASGRFPGLFRSGVQDAVGFPAACSELFHQLVLQMHVLFNVSHFPVPHGTDAVLWIITIHHQYVIPLQVMEVTGEQYRERGFSHTAFLVAQSDK